MSEFRAWPKTPRLNRNCIATEKIDGTNCAVIIELLGVGDGIAEAAARVSATYVEDQRPIAIVQVVGDTIADPLSWYGLWAQSRKRLIRPNSPTDKAADNFGFAAWVRDNALELAVGLGEGYHYGEWWGSSIQRGYNLPFKRFSLFNVSRWHDAMANGCGPEAVPTCCNVVPVLAAGTNINEVARVAEQMLRDSGSFASPTFDNPEGIIVYHTAARQTFKVTLENDAAAKGTFKGMHS